MWGVANWPAELISQALQSADAQGAPRPCAAQLPYSLVQRGMGRGRTRWPAILRDEGVGLVASYALAGGTLTGKYRRGETGRVSTDQDNAVLAAGRAAAAQLAELGQPSGMSPRPRWLLPFALAHPHLSSVLFGATSPAQIDQNVRSIEVLQSLDRGQIERLRTVGGESG